MSVLNEVVSRDASTDRSVIETLRGGLSEGNAPLAHDGTRQRWLPLCPAALVACPGHPAVTYVAAARPTLPGTRTPKRNTHKTPARHVGDASRQENTAFSGVINPYTYCDCGHPAMVVSEHTFGHIVVPDGCVPALQPRQPDHCSEAWTCGYWGRPGGCPNIVIRVLRRKSRTADTEVPKCGGTLRCRSESGQCNLWQCADSQNVSS